MAPPDDDPRTAHTPRDLGRLTRFRVAAGEPVHVSYPRTLPVTWAS